jgi:ATP-dependent helicase HepA
MLKRLVRHEQFGEGRIAFIDRTALRVVFFSSDGSASEQSFARDALDRGIVTPNILELGRACQSPDGECEVLRALPRSEEGSQSYEVRHHSGTIAVYSEADLDPLPSLVESKPSAKLAGRDFHHLVQFRSREAFRTACIRNLRQGGKLTALLSARINLHPHQAFVAGTVLDDRRKRYILADEVGLGKTIEAGIVIHDLLSGNQHARVLIICPGTLTEQWLCEIYSKFGGQVFTLVDLHPESEIQWSQVKQVIVSTAQILQFASEPILNQAWDLVVIDECHHLLSGSLLYRFAASLSRRTRSLLLLSAIPAQQNESEYFNLLALLEPDKFDPGRPEAIEDFKRMYDAQTSLSRRLQPLTIRMRGLSTGDYTLDDILRQVTKLLDLPLLSADERLQNLHRQLGTGSEGHLVVAQQIVDHVADRYRVYRRILRNRRKVLQSERKIETVTRTRDVVRYEPGPLEQQAWAAVGALLENSLTVSEDGKLVQAFARTLWQSLASSDCSLDLLQNVPKQGSVLINDRGREFLSLGHLAGYEDWGTYCPLLQGASASFVDPELLQDAIQSIRFWADSSEQGSRYRTLTATIRQVWTQTAKGKILLFAGYPDLAEEVHVALVSEFGAQFVTGFRFDMTRSEKELSAQVFRNTDGRMILVSDETGGEGRNFEFADAVLHYDTPWQVAKVEQRIGRLDRIGRHSHRSDVRSIVICATGTIEEALIRCYDEGINVYRESVSGLEFSLHDQELRICDAALRGGFESLEDHIEALRQASNTERDRDAYDALLDWASFNEDRAQTFLSVSSKPEVETALEASFIEYFQSVAKTRAVRAYSDDKTPSGLWEFNLDWVRPGIFPFDVGGALVGTFQRAIALSRPDRAFLQVGNPHFDWIVEASLFHPALKTYAVQCRATTSWVGFEFVYSGQPDMTLLKERPDLGSFVRSLFSFAPVHIFLDIQGQEGDSPALKALRQSLTRENKDKTWVNLWHDREATIDNFVPRSSWAVLITELEAKAAELARKRLAQRMLSLDDFKLRWSANARRFREVKTAVSAEEARTLDLLIAIASGWTVFQEAAGFFVVNPTQNRLM